LDTFKSVAIGLGIVYTMIVFYAHFYDIINRWCFCLCHDLCTIFKATATFHTCYKDLCTIFTATTTFHICCKDTTLCIQRVFCRIMEVNQGSGFGLQSLQTSNANKPNNNTRIAKCEQVVGPTLRVFGV